MRRFRPTGELGVALGLLGLALVVALDTRSIVVTPTYARIGPRVFPIVVAIGMAVVGATLLVQAWTGQWRADAAEPADRRALLLVAAGLLLDTLLMRPAGFVLASTSLFACVARAFGSRALVRDAVAGALLATAAYLVFTRLLGLDLPAGSLFRAG